MKVAPVLKLILTISILFGLLLIAASTLMSGLLLLAFSTDGIHQADKLPETTLAIFAGIACLALLYASLVPPILFWSDASWRPFFRPIKIGWSVAIVALIIDLGIIIKVAGAQ